MVMETDTKEMFNKVRQSFINIGSDMKMLNDIIKQSTMALKSHDKVLHDLDTLFKDLNLRVKKIEDIMKEEEYENVDEERGEEEKGEEEIIEEESPDTFYNRKSRKVAKEEKDDDYEEVTKRKFR